MTEQVKTMWSIDPGHSEVNFKVRHIGISNVSGTFKVFQGEVSSDNENFDNAAVHFTLNTASIDTNNTVRDGHLASAQFLNAEEFPEMLFDGVLQERGGSYMLAGELTICGVKNSVELAAEHPGTGMDRMGRTRAGFELKGKISRKAYGLKWEMFTDTGTLIIGDEIQLHFDIQLIRK